MAQLPIDQAVPRFKENEDRINTFTNGLDDTTWQVSGGATVPSLRNLIKAWTKSVTDFISNKNTEINGSANTILSGSTSARDAAVIAKTAAEAARDTAAGYGNAIKSTSATYQTVAIGDKTFVTQAGKQYSLGQRLRAANNDGSIALDGEVTAYTATSGGNANLTIRVDYFKGSGTNSVWNINYTGARGESGSVPQMNEARMLGRPAASGIGDPQQLTAAMVLQLLDAPSRDALQAVSDASSPTGVNNQAKGSFRTAPFSGFPAGLLINWGIDQGDGAKTFATPYETLMFGVVGSCINGGAAADGWVWSFTYERGSSPRAQFVAHPRYQTTGGSFGIPGESYFWIAFGV